MDSSENLTRRERKKLETRQRLLTSAMELFRNQGFDATTVEEIAETASVAKGTFFNYFETKDAILPALAEWRLQQLGQALAIDPDIPASHVERIKATLTIVAQELLADHLPTRRLFAAIFHRRDVKPGRALTRLLADQVRQAQAAGEVRDDLDPAYIAGIIRALLFQQMMAWHHGTLDAPLSQLLCSAVDLLLDGVGGPRWGQAP